MTLFLAGDVMTGRGIDNVLPHPCDPQLYEEYLKSSADYVALAEKANGPIARPVGFAHVWGDALAELERRHPDVRLINLETAITTHTEPEPKGINYRMNPANIAAIAAARVDCCVLANNHVLDWGQPGLLETLETLKAAGIKSAGAGRDQNEATAPTVLPVPGGRVIVHAFGSPTSGISRTWAATPDRPGVNFLPDLSDASASAIAARLRTARLPGDIVVASLHWGGNWGYDIAAEQVSFAHRLIDDSGVDVVFGHSSHHPKAIEVYQSKLILYGCGDFIDDYEGIRGYEAYRDDLVLMYLPTVRQTDGTLDRLTMVPFQIRNFRLNRAGASEAQWLRNVLDREGRAYGTRVRLDADDTLALEWD